jgi:hypothetical protein
VCETASLVAEKGEHVSVPWKAYLAAREFQNLASDLADGLFSGRECTTPPDLSVPAILRSDVPTKAEAASKPSSLLLTPISLAENVLEEPDPTRQAFDFAVAA